MLLFAMLRRTAGKHLMKLWSAFQQVSCSFLSHLLRFADTPWGRKQALHLLPLSQDVHAIHLLVSRRGSVQGVRGDRVTQDPRLVCVTKKHLKQWLLSHKSWGKRLCSSFLHMLRVSEKVWCLINGISKGFQVALKWSFGPLFCIAHPSMLSVPNAQ